MKPIRRSLLPSAACCVAIALLALCANATARSRDGAGLGPGGKPAASPFDGDGMWIWIVSRSHGGSPDAIAARAKASGIETVFVKSGDGTSNWSQFSPGFVSALKKRGLRVCAWQYVYGRRPAAEAAVSARAVKNGADCFVIDAEAEYEGRYSAARTYVRKLRGRVGPSFPIGLAAFPYVNYHPSFPYSVFLAPGAAQFNLPQMYWRAIGVSVSSAYATTYIYNRPYDRPIYPLGQVYMNPAGSELSRFRALAQANGATGVSWWDWQEAKIGHWRALAKPITTVQSLSATTGFPTLGKGSKGDLVLWAQQHLSAAGYETPETGYFRNRTAADVSAFRASKGLGPGTSIDPATWHELLKFTPDTSAWLGRHAKPASISAEREPASASLPAKRYEIPAHRTRP